MTQLTLPGFDVPLPVPEHRFFFATMPDPATAARISEIAEGLRSEKRRVLHTERLHVTLYSLGDFAYVPGAAITRACAAADRIDVPSFCVTFDQILGFNGRPGHWPLVLTGGEELGALIDFQKQLAEALGKVGLRVSGKRFTPHVTLLYGERRLDRRTIEPITWTVREFILIHSWIGRTHYDVMGRWPLTDSNVLV